MSKRDLRRVVFYSKEDMGSGYQLSNGEHILKSDTKTSYEDINDILELYNIKKFLDNNLYLKKWSEEEISEFKQKAKDYGNVVGHFMSKIDDTNAITYFDQLSFDYVNSFFELINNHKLYKRISDDTFSSILSSNSHIIRTILTYRLIVNAYDECIRIFLLSYSHAAEILISVYEESDIFGRNIKLYLPKSLSLIDKENIISNYIDNLDSNSNYLRLIQNAKNTEYFKLSDKVKLKAKRKEKIESEKFFKEKNNGFVHKYGASISFPENPPKIKDAYNKDFITHYSYSLSYIKQYNDPYTLYSNFVLLFEYLDNQKRINLVSNQNQMGIMERTMGIHSRNEYRVGIVFNMLEISSFMQIVSYSSIINELGKSLEHILQSIFSSTFATKYNFASNARLSMPSPNSTNLEKVRFLAPEFESILKQFKLFVEDNEIDFELLQMSSMPCSISDIPSLNKDKYVYLNKDNTEILSCSNLFFSDQTLLAYVEPYKEKHYRNFFDLLANEEVDYNKYEEHQKPQINYLIEKGLIHLNNDGKIKVTNIYRVLILKNLYENEFISQYHFPPVIQSEIKKMKDQNMIYFESSLFSKQEQSYFNYYLNKKEFTNGFDLRNSYLHGTQANHESKEEHKFAYFTYLKLVVLVLLKIEDDLQISSKLNC